MGWNCRASAIQLYLQASRHYCNSTCQVVIEILGPVGQVVNLVVQVRPVIFVDGLDKGSRLV